MRRRISSSAWVAAIVMGVAGALGGCGGDTCEPEGELFAESPQIGVLALDEEAVYWTAMSEPAQKRNGEVWRKPKDGGAPERLYQSAEDPIFPFPRLSVDATHVYWLETCSQPGATPCAEVRRIPKAGGAVQTLVRDRVYAFAVDGDTVYFTTSNEQQIDSHPSAPGDDGTVWAMPKDGSGPPVALVSNLARLRHVAVDGSHVYFVASRGTPPGVAGREVWISRVPKTGGEVEAAALLSFRPEAFVLTEQELVLREDRMLLRVGKGEEMPVMLYQSLEPEMVRSFATAGDTVYFADEGHTEGRTLDPDATDYVCGAIRSVPLAGGTAKSFAQEQVRPQSLITDGEMLYWAGMEPGFNFATIRRSKR